MIYLKWISYFVVSCFVVYFELLEFLTFINNNNKIDKKNSVPRRHVKL